LGTFWRFWGISVKTVYPALVSERVYFALPASNAQLQPREGLRDDPRMVVYHFFCWPASSGSPVWYTVFTGYPPKSPKSDPLFGHFFRKFPLIWNMLPPDRRKRRGGRPCGDPPFGTSIYGLRREFFFCPPPGSDARFRGVSISTGVSFCGFQDFTGVKIVKKSHGCKKKIRPPKAAENFWPFLCAKSIFQWVIFF